MWNRFYNLILNTMQRNSMARNLSQITKSKRGLGGTRIQGPLMSQTEFNQYTDVLTTPLCRDVFQSITELCSIMGIKFRKKIIRMVRGHGIPRSS